jgi:N-acetylmuramoyl-L-alanine amidase
MKHQSWPAIALFSLLPTICAAKPGVIQVTSVRAWSHASTTRVVLETSGPFEFKADRASNPDRLFFDILNARPWIAGKRLAVQQVNDALVQRVRIAETAPDTTRVVFDLTGPASFTVTALDAPDRMVIEVRAYGAPLPSPITRQSVRPSFTWPPAGPSRRPRSVFSAGVPPTIPASPMPGWISTDALVENLAKLPRSGQHRIEAAYVPPPQVQTSAGTSGPLTLKPAPGVGPTRAGATSAADAGTRSLTRALGLKVHRIVIDAGHGGHDEGTSGPHGVLEKDVVLDVALRVAKLVETRLGAEVVLTRSDDTFIPLTERTAIANQRKADLFLSIHANSSPAPAVAGTETFFLNFTSNPTALDVASRENAGSDKAVAELQDLIQKITLNDKIAESQTFAQTIQNSIFTQAARANAAAKNRGVKRAPFVVLIGASMPSVLAEIGFLTNPRDESNLGKADYRQKIAEALYRGVAQYSQSLGQSPVSSYPASTKVAGKIETSQKHTPGIN